MNPSMKSDEDLFDIIQAPNYLNKTEIPEFIEVNNPFIINGITYILIKVENNQFVTCYEIEGENKTSCSKKARNFYIIKRL